MKPRSLLFRSLLLALTLSIILPLGVAARDTGEPDTINILLIGRDSREETPGRSDSVILCTICPAARSVTTTSFLRDLYLPIPGNEDNRLNAAYAFGGADLLQQTLQQQFDIETDGYVEADFSSFPQIIDLLGGVELQLRQDEAEAINAAVPGALAEGSQLLNGSQALAYSRLRKLDQDGDFGRSSRQRKLISALLESYRSADLLTILSVVVDVLPMLSTDLSKREILALAVKLFPLLDDPAISSQRIPADGTYSCQRIRGMDVLVADMESNKKIIMDTLSGNNHANK